MSNMSDRIANSRSVYEAANIALGELKSSRDTHEIMRAWEAYQRRYQRWFVSLSHDERKEAVSDTKGDPSAWDTVSPIVSSTGKAAKYAVRAYGVGAAAGEDGRRGVVSEGVKLFMDHAVTTVLRLGEAPAAALIFSLTPSKTPSSLQEVVGVNRSVNDEFMKKLMSLAPPQSTFAGSSLIRLSNIPSGPTIRPR